MLVFCSSSRAVWGASDEEPDAEDQNVETESLKPPWLERKRPG